MRSLIPFIVRGVFLSQESEYIHYGNRLINFFVTLTTNKMTSADFNVIHLVVQIICIYQTNVVSNTAKFTTLLEKFFPKTFSVKCLYKFPILIIPDLKLLSNK